MQTLTGRDLKAERVREGLTQAQLAERLGVSRSRVSQIEGRLRPPDRQVARYWAALGRPV